MSVEPTKATKIFFCYAREDEVLRKELEKQLRVLQRQGFIDVWYDRNISAGAEWEQEIKKHLNEAQIILLLISPDFMDSDYCYSTEMIHALERHNRREACVIPIILRPIYWQGAPFGKLQALPTDAKPITGSSWHTLDEAFFDVAEGIRRAIRMLPAQNPLPDRFSPFSLTQPDKREKQGYGRIFMQTQTVYPMSDPSLSPVPLKKSAKESRTNNKVVGGITASLCNIPIAYLLIRSVPLSSVSIQVTYLFVFSDILAALFISARSIFVLASINCIFIVFAFYFLPWSIEYVQAIPVNGYGSMVGSMVLVPIIAQISTAIIVYLLVRKLSPLKQP